MSNAITKSISRTTFTVSRAAEFFSEKELEMQMGAGRECWLPMLLKELIDNTLDACESAGISPEIQVEVGNDHITVRDNGPGIPAATVTSSLDYLSRTSSNNLYISPTRGQLGNALKCAYAAGYVVHGAGMVTITAMGVTHTIAIGFDAIVREPSLNHQEAPAGATTGTVVRISWPRAACELADGVLTTPQWLAWRFGLCNPHARIQVLMPGDDPADGWFARPLSDRDRSFSKWKPDARIPASWFYQSQFKELLCAHLASTPKLYVRDFIRKFHGMSATYIQAEVLDNLGQQRTTITDAFTSDGEVLDDRVMELHNLLSLYGGDVRAKRLGSIGKDISGRLGQRDEVRPGSLAYRKVEIEDSSRPFLIEGWFAAHQDTSKGRQVLVSINHSPVFEMPAFLISNLLAANLVDPSDPVTVVLHMACPGFNYTDRGKTRIAFSPEQQQAITTVMEAILKQWKCIKNRLRRDQRATDREIERLCRKESTSIREAAWSVIAIAYDKASGGGKYPANARQVMYAARGPIQEMTGKTLDDVYFTQTLLPDYQAENRELTAGWDVVYDDRGTLVEPHTRRPIPIGTVKVRNYIRSWCSPKIGDATVMVSARISTSGPEGRFGAALFIEKEGFTALFEAAGTAERFDVAIFSTKGMSTTASRQLVDHLARTRNPDPAAA